VDFSKWQTKKWTPEDDMAENIPEKNLERVRITWEETEDRAVSRGHFAVLLRPAASLENGV